MSLAVARSPIDDLVARAERVGVFPVVAARVQEVASDPNSSAADLERLIALDAALSARVLRLANSPAYGSRRTVATLRHAVMVLGFREASQVCLALAMMSSGPSTAVATELWMHALRTAILARGLAARSGALEPGEAFLAGMMHDFGSTVLLTVVDGHEALLARAPHGTAQLDAERAAYGADHAALAAACLAAWKFSRTTVLSVQGHHAPVPFVGFDGRPAFCGDALVYLADEVEQRWIDGVPPAEIGAWAADSPCGRRLELSGADVQDVAATLGADIAAFAG